MIFGLLYYFNLWMDDGAMILGGMHIVVKQFPIFIEVFS